MAKRIMSRLARHGWVLVVLVTVAAGIGVYLHFSQARAEFTQREVAHRSELLLYDLKEVIAQRLNITRGLAAYVYSEMLVHDVMSEQKEAQALLQAYASMHAGVLVQAAIYFPGSRVPVHYADPALPGLPLPPADVSDWPTLAPGQMRITVAQAGETGPLLRTFHKVCAQQKCSMLIVDIAARPVLEHVLKSAGKRQLAADMSINVSIKPSIRAQVSADIADHPEIIPLYISAPRSDATMEGVWKGSFDLAGSQFIIHAVAMPALIADLFAHAAPLAFWGLMSGIIISLVLILWGYSMMRYNTRLRRDVQKRSQDALDKRHRLASILDHARDAILFADMDGAIRHANPAACSLFGYRSREWRGLSIDDLLLQDVHEPWLNDMVLGACSNTSAGVCEVQARRKDGSAFFAELIANTFLAAGEQQLALMLRDISERKDTEAKLMRLSSFDTVTRLPNRWLFTDRLGRMMELARRGNYQIGLLVLDIDRFREINDTMGFSAGDQVLQITAGRLLELLREPDSMARMDGNEFAIMLPDADISTSMQVAGKVKAVLSRPYDLQVQEVSLGVSIGVAVFPDDGDDVETLIRHAATAMNFAKHHHLNIHCFENAIEEQTRKRLQMEQELSRAMDEGQLRLYYQSKHRLVDGEIIGLEGLIRWQHPEHGLIPPDQFVPLAEETGLVHPISFLLLEQACQQAIAWKKDDMLAGRIGINLSAVQLIQKGLAQEILATIREAGARPEWIEIEITETAAMDDPELACDIMQELVNGGISIAIDDFGTGYSSLAYLKRFPADWLKIDMAFIRDLPDDKDNVAIVRSTIKMAHDLNMKVIAEGVETETQLEFLRQEGCDAIQGYLFSPPLSADETSLHLERCCRLAAPSSDPVI
ncbi:MAG: EAL domain-containing protein [Mariprofundus sp.]|nr:EAL domain-containing protein [Mariprofundus sp.]